MDRSCSRAAEDFLARVLRREDDKFVKDPGLRKTRYVIVKLKSTSLSLSASQPPQVEVSDSDLATSVSGTETTFAMRGVTRIG